MSKTNNNGCFSDKVLIYGKHPFFAVLKSKKRKIYQVYVSEKNKNEFFEVAKKEDIRLDNKILNFLDSSKLDSIFPYPEKNHQGYMLQVSKKDKVSLDDFLENITDKNNLPKLLILDSIVDPHNLGAIIRTAVAFGITDIVVTTFNSVKDTPVVTKTSAGLSELVNIIEVVNLNNTIKDLKDFGYFVFGLDGEAKVNISSIKDNKNIALVLGNEGKGIRDLVKKNCDELVKIPMSTDAESLNVSVASAIAIYELWGGNDY